jgi:excinuclease ABC subunit A
VLAPVLAAGPYEKRKAFDFAAHAEKREDDLDIHEVGQEAQMPWEADGRRWHTQDRVGRNGEPCRWDGAILEKIVDKIHELGKFGETNWNARSVVEIAAERKSDGWFFHAITGEPWLLKLKFRVAKNTFKREKLAADLGLKPLNDLEELPIYGRKPRVRCKNLRGPWQEVQLDAHSLEEIDTPEFGAMLERAVAGFFRFTERVQQNPEDIMPWKVLGRKWHFSRRGFPPGRRVDWDAEVLEDVCELLHETAGEGQFLWNNQQVVHLMVKEQREPWASLYTKRPGGLDLILNGPKDAFALGRVAHLSESPELQTDPSGRDQLKLRFQKSNDLPAEELAAFLKEHLTAVKNGGA